MIRRYEPTSKEVEAALRLWLTDEKDIPLDHDTKLEIRWKTGSQWIEGEAVPQISWDDQDYGNQGAGY